MEKENMMNAELLKRIWKMLFDKGVVEFGKFTGLKLHESDEDAPSSPFYFNLRAKDHPEKPGPLDREDFDLIAECIWQEVMETGVGFTAICGIPNAGNSIVEALRRADYFPKEIKFIPLVKEGRKIIIAPGFNYRAGERVLLLDDVITEAGSKFEAISALESVGCQVAAVAVLIDREQGGSVSLGLVGYHTVAVFSALALLDQYKDDGEISQEVFDECFSYIKNG